MFCSVQNISYENFSFLKIAATKESSKAEDALFRLGYDCLNDDDDEGEGEDEELERDEL